MKKNILMISFIILSFFSINLSVKAETAPSEVSIGGAVNNNNKYIGQTFFAEKKLADGTWAYCLEMSKDTPSNIPATNVGPLDKYPGLVYVINNGFPNQRFTGDDKKDYYITQGAVWWYMDLVDGVGDNSSGQLTAGFKSTGQDSYDMRKYVRNLAYNAYNFGNNGEANASCDLNVSSSVMSLSADNVWFESQFITISGRYLAGTYSIDTSPLPKGSFIINEQGTAVAANNVPSKFKIIVPVSSLNVGNNSISFNINVTANYPRAYGFSPANETIQDITPAKIYTIPTTFAKGISLTANLVTTVNVTKKDKKDNTNVSGAKLVIKDASGNVVKRITSTKNKLTINDLKPGDYYLSEEGAPEGYQLNKKSQKFTVSVGKTTEIVFYNEKTITKISKQDITSNKELPGAHLVVKDQTGKIIDEWDSTDDVHYIYGLIEGQKYTLEETIQPNGYYLNKEKIEFVVLGENQTTEVVMKNTKTKTVISKKDIASKKDIKGAKLVLKNKDGETLYEWISDGESKIIEGLTIGEKYTLEEIESPKGYGKAESLTFEVKDNEATEITMYDTKLVKVPNTGINKSLLLIVAGIIFVGLGIGSLIYYKRKNV